MIKQKHEIEQRRRKIMTHRIITAAGAAVIILIIIFAVKGCVSHMAEKSEERRQEQTEAVPSSTPTEIPIENPNEISQMYYSHSAIVGNSFVEGMIIYDLIEGADYFAKVGLSVNDALTKSIQGGSVPVIDELKTDKKYNKIFMVFGENELGWVNADKFVSQYGALIDKAKEYQPQSKIYLLAITPITKKVSDQNIDGANNERIIEYNSLIQQLAADKGAVYADVYSAVKGADGTLPEGAASDGIHFGEEYYKKCFLYIQNNLH